LLSWYAAGAPESRIEREAGSEAAAAVDADELAGTEATVAWAGLDPAEQASLREAAGRFAALPAAEQDALRGRFAALDRMERRGWLFGPELGRDWPRLQPWVGYVPEEERAPALSALPAMDSGQRERLAEVLRRQSPAGRIELRPEMPALPA